MIAPLALTGGILALMYASRARVQPGAQVPAAMPGAGAPAGGGTRLDLPRSPVGTPAQTTAQILPLDMQAQVDTLLAMGEAAAPADLQALADRVALVAPTSPAVATLRARAAQNLGLMPSTTTPNVPAKRPGAPATTRGLPGAGSTLDFYGRIGACADAMRPFSYVAPSASNNVQPASVYAAPNYVQNAAVANVARCSDPEGCTFYRTPSPLYPIAGASVPGGAVVEVLQRSGDFVEIRHAGMRGWVPARALQTSSSPAPRVGSVFR